MTLEEWLENLPAGNLIASFAEAVGVIIETPAGKMDAALLLSDPWLFNKLDEKSFARRLVDLYEDEARVIYPAP